MFSFQRLGLLIRQTWAHLPRWYSLVPALGILALFLFAIGIDGQDAFERYGDTGRLFYRPSVILYVMIYANTISLTFLATHFVGRHFKNDQWTTDTLLLPVSNQERYVNLFIWVFLLLPIFGLLSAMAVFAVLKLSQVFGYFPRWEWVSGYFWITVLPFLGLAVPYFALSLLQPRRPFVWGLGIFIVFGLALGMISNGPPDFMRSIHVVISEIDNLPDPETVYGPTTAGMMSTSFTPVYSFAERPWLLFVMALLPALLFFGSGWLALKNRQL